MSAEPCIYCLWLAPSIPLHGATSPSAQDNFAHYEPTPHCFKRVMLFWNPFCFIVSFNSPPWPSSPFRSCRCCCRLSSSRGERCVFCGYFAVCLIKTVRKILKRQRQNILEAAKAHYRAHARNEVRTHPTLGFLGPAAKVSQKQIRCYSSTAEADTVCWDITACN